MRLGTIYSLIDPRTGLVRYIGQTIKLPRYRYASHKYQWKRCKGRINHVNSWIKNLAKEGLDFIMEVVAAVLLPLLQQVSRCDRRLIGRSAERTFKIDPVGIMADVRIHTRLHIVHLCHALFRRKAVFAARGIIVQLAIRVIAQRW